MSQHYKNYVLGILLLVGIFAWLDRQIFAMLMQSIKNEFAFSDTQLGLLGGVAFSVFYVSVGLVVAWLGDRFNRRNIIAVALALWSGMTALCGLATGFTSLFLARVGVGIGEAGGSPPSQSLISDYFPPEKRGTALSVFFLYIPLGFLVGYLVGGLVNEISNWRMAFYVVGLPGIALAVIVKLTVKEVPRGYSENKISQPNSASMLSTIKYFLTRRSLIHLPLAGAIYGIGAFGVSMWAPTFFMRVHEMPSGEVGIWMALAYGIGGSLGILSGGRLGDFLSKRFADVRWYTWIAVISILISMPLAIPVYLSGTPVVAFLFLFMSLFFSHMFLGPVLAMIQTMAGVNRRTQAAAFYLFLANLIAMSLGPLIIGMVSDHFHESLEALRYAILVLSIASALWAAIHFYLASKSLKEDLAAVKQT